MDSTLYIYNVEKLELLKEDLSDFQFLSIAYLIHISSTIEDLVEVDTSDINNSIIDITNLVKDGNYYRIFAERYLWTLSNDFENVHFSLQSKYLDSFKEMFPYFIDEEQINYNFMNTDGDNGLSDKKFKIHEPLVLYLYKDISTINKLYEKGLSISLSNLIDESEGIVFKYNLKTINQIMADKETIEYIDLSSAIRTLKLRSDLILQFEILIHHISSNSEIKYSLESSLSSQIMKIFPLVFIEEHYIDDCTDGKKIDDEQMELIDIKKIDYISKQINERLRGHSDFKTDFKNNLLKFSFLNHMDERKILSVLLCGDSGIGKTEFAKIISNIMYPEEPLIKINFGNYSTEGVLNSLIGSPLGYVGSEEGGELINKINTSKSKVILIDEFEKANSSVFNLFYELLEDGRFTDRHGFEHDLDGYIIVFTSNMSQKEYQKYIPDALKSRLDMIYYFTDLEKEEKVIYIEEISTNLIKKLKVEFNTLVDVTSIKEQLDKLIGYKNLRDIKREVENIIFNKFFDIYRIK